MKSLLLLAVLCASAVFASEVIELEIANFDDVVNAHPLIMVEFYAPWCGHCKKLAPEYDAASEELKGEAVLAKIDASSETNGPLAQKYGIKGFPTLKLFRNGNVASDYQGGRTKDDIVAFMKRQALPAIIELADAAALEEMESKHKVFVVGFFTDKESADYKIFAQTADKMRETHTFAVTFDSKIAESQFVSAPAVVLYKQFDDRKNTLQGSDELPTMEAFIVQNSLPWLDEVGQHNYQFYASSGKPCAFVFVKLSEEGAKDQFPFLQTLAKETRGKLNFVFIDFDKFARYGENIGLSGQKQPAIAIEDFRTSLHYAFDENEEITEESLRAWVDDFLAGKMSPTIKSQPIPEANDEPVKVAVAKNFDSLVMDDSKDVLLEFYAPWCGHCKSLAPIYEETAQALAGVSTLVIAKMDATANDVNPKYGVRGFPTIKFFPAGKKDTPIDYTGARTKEGFLTFLQASATHPFDLPKDEL